MSAPQVQTIRVPFLHDVSPEALATNSCAAITTTATTITTTQDSGSSERVFITNVFIELVTFAPRFYWFHISESPSERHVSRLGACSFSVAPHHAAAGSHPPSTPLLGFDASGDGSGDEAVLSPSAQSTFANSLSQRLVQRARKTLEKEVGVYVCCGVEGDRSAALLGTEGGSVQGEVTAEFGALVFQHCWRLLQQSMAASSSITV